VFRLAVFNPNEAAPSSGLPRDPWEALGGPDAHQIAAYAVQEALQRHRHGAHLGEEPSGFGTAGRVDENVEINVVVVNGSLNISELTDIEGPSFCAEVALFAVRSYNLNFHSLISSDVHCTFTTSTASFFLGSINHHFIS
jgi:hypothetical protein